LVVVPRLLLAAPLVVHRSYLIVVPRLLQAAPRRSLQITKAGSAATLPQQEKNNSLMFSATAISFAAMFLRLARVAVR
jgi:hypothetical protein